MFKIECLNLHPELIPKIAEIYTAEWDWHFCSEWNINSQEEMINDIKSNIDTTFIGLDVESGAFIGTVSILKEDLKSHLHLTPWITCLYVEPEMRCRGFGQQLVDFALKFANQKCYIWCYSPQAKLMYLKWGWKLLDYSEGSWVLYKMAD